MTLLANPPKTGRRGEPYADPHERSVARATRHPQRLRDFVRELEDAWQAEAVVRLHTPGVEWEPGDGGSKLGTPRWTNDFRAYVTGNDCDTTVDGDWKWPLRSSLFRMSISSSGRVRRAAEFVFLLMHCRFHASEAWARQCGPFADPAISDWSETIAHRALETWWGYYVEQPRGRPLD